MIFEVINKAGGRPPPGSGISSSIGNAISQGAMGGHSIEMIIPGPKCGLIIGKNGETIKMLQVTLLLLNTHIVQILLLCCTYNVLGEIWSEDALDTKY